MKKIFIILLISQFAISFKGNSNINNIDGIFNSENIWKNLKQILFANVNTFNVSLSCRKDLNITLEAFLNQEEWAIKMFDATAKPQSGILNGNLFHLGNYDECQSIHQPEISTKKSNNDNNNAVQSIIGKYCLGSMPLKLNKLVFNFTGLSICAPSGCTANDLTSLMNIHFKEEQCHDRSQDPELTAGDIIFICFSAILLLIIIASTSYDIYLNYTGKECANAVFLAFSVITNAKKIFTSNRKPGEGQLIECIAGIRALSIVWICHCHNSTIQIELAITNLQEVNNIMESNWTRYLRGGTVAVDSFLLISGLVLVYVYMKSIREHPNRRFKIFQFYFHRYLRLTPVLAVIIAFEVTVFKHFGDGPYWYKISKIANDCSQYWWLMLTYVHNYAAPSNQCLVPSWYLTVDNQLFLLSPLLLIPLRRWPKLTLSAAAIAALASIASAFTVAWQYKLVDLPTGPDEDFYEKYYVKTHTRAAPWFIGIIMGYLLYEMKHAKKTFYINKMVTLFLWIFAICVMLTCVFYDTFNREYTRIRMSSFIAFTPTAWALCLGWVILACENGYGGPVKAFLSLPIFQVLAKLSFTIYLVQYSVLQWIFFSLKNPQEFSMIRSMLNFWSSFALVFVFSLIVTLAIESPIIGIEKYLFFRKPTQKSKPSTN